VPAARKKRARSASHTESIEPGLVDSFAETLSMIAQLHFYFLSTHMARATFLKAVDEKISLAANYQFSAEGDEPVFPVRAVEVLYREGTKYEEPGKPSWSVGQFLREGQRTYLRQSLIFSVQATLESHLRPKLGNDAMFEEAHFRFFREARDALHHRAGRLNRRKGEASTIDLPFGVQLDTGSGELIRLSDKRLHELLLLIEGDFQTQLVRADRETDQLTVALLQAVNGSVPGVD
jgi:hypothetical protein